MHLIYKILAKKNIYICIKFCSDYCKLWKNWRLFFNKTPGFIKCALKIIAEIKFQHWQPKNSNITPLIAEYVEKNILRAAEYKIANFLVSKLCAPKLPKKNIKKDAQSMPTIKLEFNFTQLKKLYTMSCL